MNDSRRQFVTVSIAGALAAAAPSLRAQGKYPQRPITLVDAFAPGGSSDIFGRVLADVLAPMLGATVIVENRAGAGGAIGADFVAKSAPDGYTLGIGTVSTLVTAPAVNPKVPYDPMKAFSFITKLMDVPSVLAINPALPVRNMKELVELAKAKPNSLTFSTPGVGSAGHVLLEQFMQVSGARFLHVPYRGSANAITDVLSGVVDVISDNLPSLLPHVQSGKVKAIAVRDRQRLKLLPDVPTYAEVGFPDVSTPLWFGIVGPAGLPADIVALLNANIRKAVADKKFVDRLAAVGATAAVGRPEDFRAEVGTMLERYRQIVKTANITMG